MLTRVFGSDRSGHFGTLLAISVLAVLVAKNPGILLVPLAACMAFVPILAILTSVHYEWSRGQLAGSIVAALVTEVWAYYLFCQTYAFAYGKPFAYSVFG